MHACQTQDGSAALALAAANGFTDCVRLLLEVGADKEARDSVRDHEMDFRGRVCDCMGSGDWWVCCRDRPIFLYLLRLFMICEFSL
jgi:hypothetical protein